MATSAVKRAGAGAIERARWGLPFGAIVLPLMIVRPSLENILGMVRISVGPAALSAGFLFNILMVILAGFLALHALLVDKRRQRFIAIIAVVWGPFLIAATLAAIRSPVPVDATQVLFNYLTYAAVSFIGLSYGPTLSRERLTTIVALAGVVPVFIGLGQAAAGIGNRIASTFSHPNVFAFFLLIYVSFLFHAQLSGYIRSVKASVTIWALIAAALLALLLTGTRSAYLAMFLFLFVYAALRKPLLILPLALLPSMALLIPEVTHRMTDAMSGSSPVSYDYMVSAMRGDVTNVDFLSLDSGTWRRWLWQAAWPVIQQKLAFGHGLGSFAVESLSFFPLASSEGSGAHNVFVQLIYEGGVLILIAYIFLFFAVGVGLLIAKPSVNDIVYAYLIIIAFNMASVSDNMLYYLSVDVFLCFVIGCLSSVQSKAGVPSTQRLEPKRHAGSMA